MRKRAGFALLLALAPCAARAQDAVESFYRNKTVSLVIGSNVGGGYDSYGRLVARHIGKYIPGRPTIVPANMAGAGGGVAAGYIYSVAPKDGTAMVATLAGAFLDPLIGSAHLKFDGRRFNYIGSAGEEVFACALRKDAAVQSFADAFVKEALIGVSGGSTRDFPMALNGVLGTKFKLIAGYPGTREVTLAMDRNEVQGICGMGINSMQTQRPDWFTPQSSVRILAQETIKSDPAFDRLGAPLAIDFAKTPQQRQAMELIYAQGAFTRPFAMGPDAPSERVEAVRKAFLQALADPDLLAEAKKQSLDVSALPGADLAARIAKLYATPPEVVKLAQDAIAGP